MCIRDRVKVTLRAFASQAQLQQEATAAVKAKKAPNLVQLNDNHSPEVVAEHKAILPMYELLAKYPIKMCIRDSNSMENTLEPPKYGLTPRPEHIATRKAFKAVTPLDTLKLVGS